MDKIASYLATHKMLIHSLQLLTNFNVALPNEPPEISGGETNYAYGDMLDLNCTSKPSYPPSKLTW